MAVTALLALKSVSVFGPFRDCPSVQAYQGWCLHTQWHKEPVHELVPQQRSSGEVIFSLVLQLDLLRCWHSKKSRKADRQQPPLDLASAAAAWDFVVPASSCIPPDPSSHSKNPLWQWRFSLGNSLPGLKSLIGSVFGENEVESWCDSVTCSPFSCSRCWDRGQTPRLLCLTSEMIQ